jgi:hypothetical protein
MFFSATGLAGAAALLLVVGAVVASAGPAYAVLRGWLTPSPEAVSGKIDASEQAATHAAGFAGFVAQTGGRSLFYVPSAPGTEQIVEVQPEPEDENGTPRAPSKYDGPAIQAIVLDEVWFADGTKVGKGAKKGDVEVLEVNAPWDAKLRWRGGEFVVPLFQRDRVVFKDGVRVAGSAAESAAVNATDAGKTEGEMLPVEEPTDEPTAEPGEADEAKPEEAKPAEAKPAEPKPEPG